MLSKLFAWITASIITSLLMAFCSAVCVAVGLNTVGAKLGVLQIISFAAKDLVMFAPLLTLLIGTGFAIAFPVAARLSRLTILTRFRHCLPPLAGATTVVVLLLALRPIFDTTIIAGARTMLGASILVICGALGGLVFNRLTHWNETNEIS